MGTEVDARRRQELRRYQHGAIVLAAGALLAGAALLPQGDELFLIHVKNRRLSQARALLAATPQQRLSSAAAVVAHQELYLLEGYVDEAVDELEAYASAHLRDAVAWRRLASVYADAQRPDEHLRAVEHLYRLEPDMALARRLLALYRRRGDEAAEAAMLRDVMAGDSWTSEDAVRRARLESALGRPSQAVEALDRLSARTPGAFDYAALELYASLLIDPPGLERLAETMQRLPIAREQPEVLAQLARVLNGWGRSDAAVALFDTPAGLDPPAERLAMRARAAIGTVEAPRVARELVSRDAERPLPSEPLEALLTLLLANDHYDGVEAVLANPLRLVDTGLAQLAIAHALSHGRRDVAQALIASVGDDSLTESPQVALELAVERGDEARAERWIAALDAGAAMSAAQHGAVAQLEDRLGYPARAFARLVPFVRNGSAPDWAAGDFADLGERLGRVQEAREHLARSPTVTHARAWARLTARAAEPESLVAWLAPGTRDRSDADALGDVYYALAQRRYLALALQAADELYRVRREPADAVRLGRALMAANRPAAALGPLRAVASTSEEARTAYEEALSAAQETGAPVDDELRRAFLAGLGDTNLSPERRAFLVSALHSAGERATLLPSLGLLARHDLDRWLSLLTDAAIAAHQPQVAIAIIGDSLVDPGGTLHLTTTGLRQQEERLQALMSLGASDQLLLPHLHHMATVVGGTWVYAYDERLARNGRSDDRIRLWTTIADSPNASAGDWRAAAIRLHDLGSRDTALVLAQRLADVSGPEDPDLHFLLQLWGPQTSDGQIAWLKARWSNGPEMERRGWWQHIVSRADRAQLRTAAEGPDPTRSLTTDEHRLLGRAALAHDLPDVAHAAFQDVLAATSDDREALRWLAAFAFYDGKTELARERLDAYFAAEGDDAEAWYQSAELSRQAGDRERADVELRRALARIASSDAGLATDVLHANILTRLGERARARQRFEAILRADPGRDHARADYVAALLGWGNLRRARAVLRAAPGDLLRTRRDGHEPTDDTSGFRRLALLDVQVLTQQGRYASALRALARLEARFPQDPDVLLARARFDAERGRPADADRHLAAARARAPERTDIVRLSQLRARERAPRASIETERRSITSAWDERSTRMTLDAPLRPYMPASLLIERRQVTASGTPDASRSTAQFDRDVSRLEVAVERPLTTASRLRTTLFGTSGGLGGGVSLSHSDVRGQLDVVVESGRPFWDLFEAAADDGRRSRVVATRQWRLRPDTSAWLHAGWHRYQLASGAREDTTVVSAGLVRTVRHSEPSITLQYGLDRETVRRRSTPVTTPGPARFELPPFDREVHLIGAIGRASLQRHWEVEGALGYTLDRLGGRGTFFTAKVTPRPGERLGVGVWVDRRQFTMGTSQQMFRAGVQLTMSVAP